MTELIDSIDGMQAFAAQARMSANTIALVPTMGYLHAGHASLMEEGRRRAELLVASIFVNPAQFGAGEDFATYPRDLERDMALAQAAGVDIVFAPKASEMYPHGYQTYVNVDDLTLPLCGKSRPGHFRGVTTVVAKLINIVQPHMAIFGKKDYQQLAVIRRMAADLNMTVEIIGMPIVREADGLAMSSRNAYLSVSERRSALCLSRALQAVKSSYRSGETAVEVLRQLALDIIGAEPLAQLDYAEIYHEATLSGCDRADDRTLVALAVNIGITRLIDNCVLGEE